MDKGKLSKMDFSTRAIHAGYEKNEHGALATPIYQTSTFTFESAEQGGNRFAGEEAGFVYSRISNPTNTQLENKLANLENAEAAVTTGSGIGAITSTIWSFTSQGDHIVASKTLYGCTYAFLSHGISKYGIEVTFVDTSDSENVRKAMRDNTTIVYLETPANPNMGISDIEEISKIAHENENCKVIVDNTYCTPYIQRPLDHGADIVVHSGTKYLNGHGDVIAGFVVSSQENIDQVRNVGIKDMTGSVMSAMDAYLIIRGMKTLNLRMDRHCSNAQKVAEFLQAHPLVEKIYYPGLESFPQHELAKKQMSLPGGMIAFEIKGGLDVGRKLMNTVELCTLAVSLGDAETLIQHPASMTHSPYTPEEREECGIPEGLVRLSIGLESSDDIIADLKTALDKLA